MEQVTFTLTGGVNVQVVVTELDDGTLKFDIAVLDETGSIGDLNGLFFDIADDALVDGLTVSGDDITDSAFKANKVTKVDGYNNVNGEVVNDAGKFDGGVQFGTSGIGVDDIRETSFILDHDSVDLTLDMILSQDFAVRLTSVGEEDGSREGSLKIGGEAPPDPDQPPVDDPDFPTDDPDGPSDDPDGPTEDPDGPTEDPDLPVEDPDGPTEDPDSDGPPPDGPGIDDPDGTDEDPGSPPEDPTTDGPPPDGPSLDDPEPDGVVTDGEDPTMDEEFIFTPDELDGMDPLDVGDDFMPIDDGSGSDPEPVPEPTPEDILSPDDFIMPIDDGSFG